MTLTIQIPKESEAVLERAFGGNLDRAACEALAISGYSSGKLSLGEVAQLVGLETGLAANQWLVQRGVPLNYTPADLQADGETLARVLGTVSQ